MTPTSSQGEPMFTLIILIAVFVMIAVALRSTSSARPTLDI